MKNNTLKTIGKSIWRCISYNSDYDICRDMDNLRSYPKLHSSKETSKIRKRYADRIEEHKKNKDFEAVSSLKEHSCPDWQEISMRSPNGRRKQFEKIHGYKELPFEVRLKIKNSKGLIRQDWVETHIKRNNAVKNNRLLESKFHQNNLKTKEDWAKFYLFLKTKGYKSKKDRNALYPLPSMYEETPKDRLAPKRKKILLSTEEKGARKSASRQKGKADKIKRTPTWLGANELKEIEKIYLLRNQLIKATGKAHHVDHVIPLKGKNISGLHVPSNLQVLPAKINISKNNKINLNKIENMTIEAQERTKKQIEFIKSHRAQRRA
jgi:hypothetical protein